VDRHDTRPFTRSSSHTHTVMVGGGRKGLGRLEPSTTGSKPALNQTMDSLVKRLRQSKNNIDSL